MALASKGAPPKWLSTHPAGSDRIAEIKRHLPEVMPLYAHAKGVDINTMSAYRTNVKGIDPVSYPGN
jgi:predicted Zn-dependent protease